MHTASNQIVLKNIYKNFGTINALKDVSMVTDSGKIHCILGDNGAGKSTLVNIISGVFQPDQGEYTVNEKRVLFKDPRQALDAGISTVYQNLAIIPIMNIYRNFFLGNEPTHGPRVLFLVDRGRFLLLRGLCILELKFLFLMSQHPRLV